MLNTSQTTDLHHYIELSGEDHRPHIRGRRIPVATVAYNYHHNHWTVPEVMANFTLSEAEVLAALLYFQEHTAEIDVQEAQYQAELDRLYHLHNHE